MSSGKPFVNVEWSLGDFLFVPVWLSEFLINEKGDRLWMQIRLVREIQLGFW
jgi:hypothetical protein